MNIGKLNVRITFQKAEIKMDDIGNQESAWSDYYLCYATTSTKTGDEAFSSAQTVQTERLYFTVRYSSETAEITTDGFRILLNDRIYNIKSIDDMAFKHNSLKFCAELERRQE